MSVSTRWLGAWLGALLLLVVSGCSAPTASAPASGPPSASQTSTATPASQPRIVDRRHVGGRSWDLIIDSPAVGNQVPVRILLPAEYKQGPQQRWPVLYLLHGCCDTYLSWTRSTDIEKLAAKLKALVVMPDGGQVGFYSNWLDGPQWEIFHTQELPQLLAAEYRANSRAAIAGLSMGGLGALGYAARHPGQYAAAASFSGIVHTRMSPEVSKGYLNLVSSYSANPLGLWGDPAKEADVWKQHNPYDLAAQLRSTALFVSAGNGEPGPLDLQGAVSDTIEASIGQENRAFVRQLRQLQVPAHIDLYGDGTHSWVYFQRELHRAWPMITAALMQKPG